MSEVNSRFGEPIEFDDRPFDLPIGNKQAHSFGVEQSSVEPQL